MGVGGAKGSGSGGGGGGGGGGTPAKDEQRRIFLEEVDPYYFPYALGGTMRYGPLFALN